MNAATTTAARSIAVRFRWTIVLLAVVLAGLAGAFGADVESRLKSGGFEDPGSESDRVHDILDQEFGAGDPDVVLVVTAHDGSVDDAEVTAAAQQVMADLQNYEGVEQVASYWSLGSPPPLRSTEGDKAMIFAQFAGEEDDRLETARDVREDFTIDGNVIDVAVGGQTATFSQVNETIESDLVLAEMIALPLTALLLVFIFGSVASALLPLVIGGMAIIGTFGVLSVIGSVTDVSIFSLNFTTAMGLGLAIDYSLLVVSRFREELDAGHDVPVAVSRTVRTAGRTVMVSAMTVAASLVALLVFSQYFLRSFAYAGIAVVGLAAVGATVVLPAILALIGHGVNRWQVRRPRPASDESGGWHRLAMTVMRRPVPIATAAILFLLLLGAPFLGVELGFPDDRVLPPGESTRDVGDVLRDDFESSESSPVVVVVDGIGDPNTHADAVATYAAGLSALEGVARVDAMTGSYIGGSQVVGASPASQRFVGADATYLNVLQSVEPISPEGESVVRDVRSVDAPFETLVGGRSAELVDGKDGMFARLPLALGIIAVITFVVLFMSFGSVLMPIKAIVLNLLSLGATFGALVWVFQDGHLAGVLDFTATGTLVISMPVLMFIVAFGLSMDYEVFMLSRVKEEYDRTGDDVGSVALGLERTGRIVTAAAILIAVVFAAFATGSVSFMKMFGVGLMLAVLVDAFVVRTTLVPAFMRLAGRANWWAPAPLRRFHDRFGFHEHVDTAGFVPGVNGVSPVASNGAVGESGRADDSDMVTAGRD